MKRKKADNAPVQSTRLSIRIVETLHERGSLNTSEVAEKMDIAASTAHRHLTTLEEYGYVAESSGKYKPGFRFLEIGEQCRNRLQIYQVAKPTVKQLADKTNERAQLMIEEGGMGIRLYLEDGQQGVSTNTLPGQHVFLHTNSGGKAILAHLPIDRREEIIEEMPLPAQTPNTITEADKLRTELEEIRQRGFSLNDGERIEGLRAVGVPIMGPDDSAIGSVSVAGPSKRFNDDQFREHLPSVVSGAANEIELNLQYC